MNGESLLVEYKIHSYRYDNFSKYELIISQAMSILNHIQTTSDDADLHFYNHCHVSELNTENNIIFKPTDPTSKHFALDTIGYANSSSIAFKEPDWFQVPTKENLEYIQSLIENKSNKWDDSILLKWRKAKNIADDHILIIGQVPTDESVNGFGFGDHFKKLKMIVEKLKGENIIVKLHPSMKIRGKDKDTIDRWIQNDIDVRTTFESIHDFLPKTRVAILENSTAGIECMMHGVPIISYGFPEYHWVTKVLQSLTELENLVSDFSWHSAVSQRMYINWYINNYLCSDIDSTVNRLKKII